MYSVRHARRRIDDNGRRVRPRRSCSVVLPEDIVVDEILVRLPVRSLLRFRCVCRSWHALFSSPNFIESHLQHAKKNPKIVITSLARDLSFISMYSYERCGPRSRHAGLLFSKELSAKIDKLLHPPHSNGLVLFNAISEVVVCNPSTREYITLPQGSDSLGYPEVDVESWGADRIGFGFVPSTNTYKVCHYFYRSVDLESGTWSIGFEVFILGVDSSWRAVEEEVPYPVEGITPWSVGELVYFEIDTALDTTLPPEIRYFSFHLADEKFRTVSLPPGLPSSVPSGFAELDGDTCFYTIAGGGTKFDVWVDLKRNETWTHVFDIDLVRPVCGIYPVGRRRGGGLLFATTDRRTFKLMRYNSQSRPEEKDAEINLATDLGYYNPEKSSLICNQDVLFHVSSYVESLVPIILFRIDNNICK